MTSNKILQTLKRHFNAAKAGHTGSLDPLATGMLPICFGEATKFSQYLLDADKTYRVTARLGIKTDTSDAEGEVIETRDVHITEPQFMAVLDKFRGNIEQVPSMYSALKVDGQPLYKLAREGKTIERSARPITIYKLDCLALSETEFSLEVSCSKGTYIRNLVEDIGEELGCGAHVTVLERLSVAGFPARQWHEWSDVESMTDFAELDALLLPVDIGIQHFPEVELAADEVDFITHGQAINYPDLPEESLIRMYDSDRRFIGLGHINPEGMLAPKRLLQIP